MKRETYYRGIKGMKYGIWNAQKKEFQFGIAEDSPMLAEARLCYMIGDDARKWRFETRILPQDIMGKKIKSLAKSIRQAGKLIAGDDISKDYFLEGRYYDTIYVTSDSGYESVTIGDTSCDTSKGYMLLYTNNTPKRDSFPSAIKIEELLWKVVRKEKLETGEGKACYFEWDCYQPIERQLDYFSEVVTRIADIIYAEKGER